MWKAGLTLAFISALASAVPAVEPAREFLEGLREQGYGDLAVAYLEGLKRDGRLPSDVAETFDLEMSQNWRVAVTEAFDAADAEKRLAKAQQHLDQFLKEHPEHPKVASALEGWAAILVDRGLHYMRISRATQNEQQKAKSLTAARQNFEQARPQIAQAIARYRKAYEGLTNPKEGSERKPPPRRMGRTPTASESRAELNWIDARIKGALVDYHLAQTFGPKDKGRAEALTRAGTALDEVYQENRGTLVGIEAHAWHGRCAQLLGDEQLALDIFDEVSAAAPEERREQDTPLAPLFAQVQAFRLEILHRQHGDGPLMVEAAAWLKENKPWQRTDGYQEVALELAKAYFRTAEKDAAQRPNLQRDALAILSDMARIPSEFQSEAIVLRRKHQKGTAPPEAVKTFDEAVALADTAAEAGDWQAAVTSYERALQLKTRTTKKDRLQQVQERLEQAEYRLGASLLDGGKFADALRLLEKIARQNSTSPVAPAAASLALSAALNLYSTGADKPAALAKLKEIAQFTESQWPGKAEADDARLTLGQASLVEGNIDAALKNFETVKKSSQRYGPAQYLAAQCHWRLYMTGRQKAATDADRKAALAHRGQAEEQLRTSLAAQRQAAEADKAPPKSLADAQLLLGELLIDKGEAKEAVAELAPLVDAIRANKSPSMDNTTLRTLVAAMQAYLAVGNAPAAGEVAAVLLGGPDIPPVNAALVSFARVIFEQHKQAQAAVLEAPMPEAEAAQAKVVEVAASLAKLLKPLGERKQNSLAGELAVAEMAAAIGEKDLARAMYERTLPKAEKDRKFQVAVTRIRSQLVGLLRQQADGEADAKQAGELFASALKQADALIAANPRALEPKLEKGRILQSWSQKDPKRFEATAEHWIGLRAQMVRMRRKPPEYYEVVYYAALSLYEQSRQNKDAKQAATAEQLLKATLVLSPKLNGPDTVARYKALVKRIAKPGPPESASTKP